MSDIQFCSECQVAHPTGDHHCGWCGFDQRQGEPRHYPGCLASPRGSRIVVDREVLMRDAAKWQTPGNSTLTVDHVPDWLSSADLIVKRGRKHYARALTQTEPRWKAVLRRIRRSFR